MITAKDIRESTFSRAARGYKVDEIDEYLEKVADSVEKLTEENKTLVKKMEILASKVQEYREDEDNIRAALITAQRSADAIVKEAKRSVEGSVAEAETKAKAIVDDANSEASKILSDARTSAESLVEETKKKASAVLAEAKNKAETMVTEAREGSRKETENFELMKRKALEFRSALLQLYKEQFEIIKDGKFIQQPKADESIDSVEKPSESAEKTEEQPEKAEKKVEEKPAEKEFKVENESEEQPSSENISDGFKIGGMNADGDKFKNLKFGDDYDVSKDEEEDEDDGAKTGIFRRKK